MKRILFQKEHKKITYEVIVEMSEEVFVSVYTSDYLFYASLKSEGALKLFYASNGKPTLHDKNKVHPFLKVISIRRKSNEVESIFKSEVTK